MLIALRIEGALHGSRRKELGFSVYSSADHARAQKSFSLVAAASNWTKGRDLKINNVNIRPGLKAGVNTLGYKQAYGFTEVEVLPSP